MASKYLMYVPCNPNGARCRSISHLFFQTIDQMVGMFFTHVFYTKIVNHETECDWSCLVSPKSWGVDAFVIPMWFESFRSNLLANIPAWGRPHTARLISKNTKPSFA
jgi:hypothetical protein